MSETLRLHHFEPVSRANGPRLRAVVWVQGCTLGCPGCFNPQTHPAGAGTPVNVNQLAENLCQLESTIEGVTISGGEPFQQIPAVTRLLNILRTNSRLSVVLFSGYNLSEIERLPGGLKLANLTDVLIAGRYNHKMRSAEGSLLGSCNQRIHLISSRYALSDLEAVPPAELVIDSSGDIWISGIDPPTWQHGS